MTQSTPLTTPDPGKALFAAGYFASPWAAGLFRVHRPAVRGGGSYIVDPATGTCNCPARVACKHRRFLVDLVFLTADSLGRGGFEAAGLELLQAWGEVTK